MNREAASGQRRAAAILSRFLETARIPSAMLFTGIEGTGKTWAAREFAKALICGEKKTATAAIPCENCGNCDAIASGLHPDVKLVDAQYQANLRSEDPAKQKSLRVETIRHLRKDMELQSLLGSWKAAIVADAHGLEPEAANALLKILEEPPARTLWILVTPRPERLLKTIASRCFRVPFAPLSSEEVSRRLVARGVAADRAAALAPLAEGSCAQALDLDGVLDSVEALGSDPLAAMALADALPKELYLARARVQAALSGAAQRLRLRHLRGQAAFSAVERPLRALVRLRQALNANADPRLVMILAGEAARLP